MGQAQFYIYIYIHIYIHIYIYIGIPRNVTFAPSRRRTGAFSSSRGGWGGRNAHPKANVLAKHGPGTIKSQVKTHCQSTVYLL